VFALWLEDHIRSNTHTRTFYHTLRAPLPSLLMSGWTNCTFGVGLSRTWNTTARDGNSADRSTGRCVSLATTFGHWDDPRSLRGCKRAISDFEPCPFPITTDHSSDTVKKSFFPSCSREAILKCLQCPDSRKCSRPPAQPLQPLQPTLLGGVSCHSKHPCHLSSRVTLVLW